MTLQCVAADLRSGRILADLTAVDFDPPMTRALSSMDPTVQAHLQLSGAPENWLRATKPRATVLAFYDDVTLADGTQPNAIEWAGYISLRHRNFNDSIDLTLHVLEEYLNHRYVTDVTYAADTSVVPTATVVAGWYHIVADMMTHHVTGGALPGITLNLDFDGDGTALDPTKPLVWQNTDNASVLTRLQQLTGQFGGDFTIDWAWGTDGDGSALLVPTLRFGEDIGEQPPAGLGPSVTFDMPGSVTDGGMDEDFSDDSFANVLTYYSSGQGDFTPYAPDAVLADFDDAPAFEKRDSPVPSETDPTRLQAFAKQALVILGPGGQVISLVVSRFDDQGEPVFGRRYGVDYELGDVIGYSLTGPAFPGGVAGSGRVISVDVDTSTVTLTFAQPEVYREPDA